MVALTNSLPTKALKDACTFLGEPYQLRVIDLENVIYRDLGEKYDIEVSGLDKNRKTIDCTVYV